MPRATSRPPALTTLTVSPRSKCPRAPVTPAGSRLLPAPSARKAPSSMRTAPAGRSVPAIHCLRAATGVEAGRNQVQRAPASMRLSGCRGSPAAMHMWHPAATAMRAAAILVAIPPEPTPEAEPVGRASISGAMCVTRSPNRASSPRLGYRGYSPKAEAAPPQRDSAGGHENQLLAALAQPQQVLDEGFEPGPLEVASAGIDQQRRADLDHNAARAHQGRVRSVARGFDRTHG